MPPLLWRIEGASATPDRDGWQQGLALHLQFQPLTIIQIRRDGLSRRYLALEGCPHCRPDGCDHSCPRALFAQLVRTTLPGIMLAPVTRIVPHTSEIRRLAARPTHHAQPLDTAMLALWEAGRLITTWSRLRAAPQPITVGVLLAVSADGPDPARVLQAAGWRRGALATALNRAAFPAEVPPPVRMGGRAGEALGAALGDPQLLLGAASAGPAIAEPPALPEASDAGAQISEGAVVATSLGEA